MLAIKAILKLLNEKKAKGPDGITPKLMKTCADQHGEVYTSIFNWSLKRWEVPMLFKESTIILVPKTSFLCLNDHRPVALTLVAMKMFESFALTHFKSLLSATFYQFQFSYRANWSSGDTISVWPNI